MFRQGHLGIISRHLQITVSKQHYTNTYNRFDPADSADGQNESKLSFLSHCQL